MSGERGQRLVVCAANRYADKIFLGARHFDERMREAMSWYDIPMLRKVSVDGEQQGFIDQHGVFMTREEAWTVAEAAGQIRFRCGGDGEKLFSENLY